MIGIIGQTGKMGTLLSEAIPDRLGIGFNRQSQHTLVEVFIQNQIIVDVSSADLTSQVVENAILYAKPTIICTTGWDRNIVESLTPTAPLIIAPNTSVGIFLMNQIVKMLSQYLGDEYDIDIREIHHRNKKDIPSGTANQLLHTIQTIKPYTTYPLFVGPRPNNYIGIQSSRSGALFGEHEVIFTSADDSIAIKHIALNRKLFINGILKLIKWLENNQIAKLYTIEEIYEKCFEEI
jgi:4-hydroxy-tetrahydrodipicolinate reductase